MSKIIISTWWGQDQQQNHQCSAVTEIIGIRIGKRVPNESGYKGDLTISSPAETSFGLDYQVLKTGKLWSVSSFLEEIEKFWILIEITLIFSKHVYFKIKQHVTICSCNNILASLWADYLLLMHVHITQNSTKNSSQPRMELNQQTKMFGPVSYAWSHGPLDNGVANFAFWVNQLSIIWLLLAYAQA